MSSHLFRRSRGCGGGAGFKAGIIGTAIGAGLMYYLFGTDSGNERRDELIGYAKKLKKGLAAAKDGAMEAVEDKKEGVIELAARMKGHLKDMKEDIEETLS